MPGESPRRFTVGGAMLFIAALALGTFAIRTAFPDPSILWSKLILDDPPGYFALMVSGRWRSEPGWVDRMGRLLGITWIAVAVLAWSRYWLWI
ncbi:MAG: hypothetical protein ACLQIB_23780 [Isosphaeraceae bacterium]